MTQLKLAEMADLNIRNVQRIEAGEFDLLLSTTVRLRKALKWPSHLPEHPCGLSSASRFDHGRPSLPESWRQDISVPFLGGGFDVNGGRGVVAVVSGGFRGNKLCFKLFQVDRDAVVSAVMVFLAGGEGFFVSHKPFSAGREGLGGFYGGFSADGDWLGGVHQRCSAG